MRLFIILFVSLIVSIKSKEEANSKTERLTYIETLDEDNTYYIIYTKEEYKEIKNLKKMKFIKIQVHIAMNGQIIQLIQKLA